MMAKVNIVRRWVLGRTNAFSHNNGPIKVDKSKSDIGDDIGEESAMASIMSS